MKRFLLLCLGVLLFSQIDIVATSKKRFETNAQDSQSYAYFLIKELYGFF